MRRKFVPYAIGMRALALLLLAGLCVVSVPQTAQAQVINSIVVQGNGRVEDDTVRAYMQISPGERADPARIDESIKALFQTGLFSDVRIFRRGRTLVVHVEENPIINKLSYEGNNELDDKELRKETELRERMVLTRARVQSDVQRLVTLYRRNGYFSARVEPKLIRLPQNRVNLAFEINEGKSTRIESIRFVGNQAFSDSELRRVISTAESAWWKFFSTADRYDPDRLAYDQELLRRHYLKHGFADFRVIAGNAELARDGESFFVTFTLEEGEQYTVREVRVNAGETTLDPNQLQKVLKLSGGERYDASKVDKSVENLSIEAGKSGFAFARVQPNIDRDPVNRTLDITYELREGPRVYIERIDIVGNTRTLDEVIRREIRLVEGDAYNRILIDRARRRLTGLGFFGKVDFRERPGSADDKVVLVIYVEEKSTGTVNFSAGYSTQEQVIGSINISERNFLGRGQNARLATSLSFKRQSVDFGFTEPYFLDRNVSAGFDLFATRTDQEDESSFTSQQFGGAIRFGFALDDYQTLFTTYKFTHRIIDVNNPATVSLATAQAEGTDNISLFGLTYVYSDLDSPIKPSSGVRFKLSGELAGLGGDVFYAKTEAAAYFFTPLYFESVVLKLKGTAGHMEGWNGKEVPILDRFYKGSDSFRGFERSGIGPRQLNVASGNVDAIGGRTYAIATAEVRFPLGLPESFGVEGAVFTDVGTLFNAPERSTAGAPVFDDSTIRASVGAGILWQSPFGPLRVDVAYPFLKADSDRTELVRFSAGTRF